MAASSGIVLLLLAAAIGSGTLYRHAALEHACPGWYRGQAFVLVGTVNDYPLANGFHEEVIGINDDSGGSCSVMIQTDRIPESDLPYVSSLRQGDRASLKVVALGASEQDPGKVLMFLPGGCHTDGSNQ